jgi:hypothetical protein
MAQVAADIHTVDVNIQETLDTSLSVSSMEELGRFLAEIADPFAKGLMRRKR